MIKIKVGFIYNFDVDKKKTRIFTKNAAHINSYHTKKYVLLHQRICITHQIVSQIGISGECKYHFPCLSLTIL
jgi:hypothetical protein